MKLIVIIPNNPFFESSAGSNRWRSLIEGLLALDVSITTIISNGYSSSNEKKELGVSGIYLGCEYLYIGKSLNETLWQRRFNHYLWSPFLKKFVRAKIMRYLTKQPAGVVWTASDLGSLELVTTLKKTKSPLKTFLELSEFLDIHHYNLGNALQRKLGDKRQAYFEQQALYAYDGLALMTHTLVNHYKGFSGKLPKIMHLPMTVDLERFEHVRATAVSEGLSRPYVVFIGVMNNKKDGVDILIEAFYSISKKYPELNVYLVGGWNYDTPGHLQRIKELNLEERVKWMGELPRDTIPSIIMNATVLALPRPDSKQAQGGFPTKLGEYLASGVPVCATTVGELPLYLKDDESVFFAEPGSVPSFAAAMTRALCDPNKAAEIGSNGKKVAVTHFNKNIQAQTLYDFLKQL